MQELMIGDKLIDPIYGNVKVLDVCGNNIIKVKVEETGAIIELPVHMAWEMEEAPPESTVKAFFEAIFIGLCIVALCTLIVIISGNVVIQTQ